MTDLHESAESLRRAEELQKFAGLPLLDMARLLSEMHPIADKPCDLCAQLARPCLVHKN